MTLPLAVILPLRTPCKKVVLSEMVAMPAPSSNTVKRARANYSLDDQGRVIAAVYRPDSEKHLTLGDMLMAGVAVMETRVKLTRDLLETAATGLYEDAIGAYWQAWQEAGQRASGPRSRD